MDVFGHALGNAIAAGITESKFKKFREEDGTQALSEKEKDLYAQLRMQGKSVDEASRALFNNISIAPDVTDLGVSLGNNNKKRYELINGKYFELDDNGLPIGDGMSQSTYEFEIMFNESNLSDELNPSTVRRSNINLPAVDFENNHIPPELTRSTSVLTGEAIMSKAEFLDGFSVDISDVQIALEPLVSGVSRGIGAVSGTAISIVEAAKDTAIFAYDNFNLYAFTRYGAMNDIDSFNRSAQLTKGIEFAYNNPRLAANAVVNHFSNQYQNSLVEMNDGNHFTSGVVFGKNSFDIYGIVRMLPELAKVTGQVTKGVASAAKNYAHKKGYDSFWSMEVQSPLYGQPGVIGSNFANTKVRSLIISKASPDSNGVFRSSDGRYATNPNKLETELLRPSLRSFTKLTIRQNAPQNSMGQFIDENGKLITNYHYGHKPGHENRRILAAADELGLEQSQLNDYVNARPEFFKIEDAKRNLSHVDEIPGIDGLDDIIFDMEDFFGF